MGEPFTVYVSGEITQVSRMTIVHPKYLKKLPGLLSFDLSHQEPAGTVGEPFTAYVSGEVTQESRTTIVHPKFLEKSFGYCGSRPSAPGTR